MAEFTLSYTSPSFGVTVPRSKTVTAVEVSELSDYGGVTLPTLPTLPDLEDEIGWVIFGNMAMDGSGLDATLDAMVAGGITATHIAIPMSLQDAGRYIDVSLVAGGDYTDYRIVVTDSTFYERITAGPYYYDGEKWVDLLAEYECANAYEFLGDEFDVKAGGGEDFEPDCWTNADLAHDFEGFPEPTDPEPIVDGYQYTLTEADLPTLEAAGLVFKGWSYNGTILSAGDVITSDEADITVTLTAEFTKPVTISFRYVSEHGTAPAQKTVTVASGKSYALTADDLPALTAEGYTFKGWTADGTTILSVGDTIYAGIGIATLTAVWEEVPSTVDYTITYETAHGAVPESRTVTVNEGESYALTADDLPTLTADGYIFGGWSVNGEVVSAGYEISADTTLTAVWEEAEQETSAEDDPAVLLAGWRLGRILASMRCNQKAYVFDPIAGSLVINWEDGTLSVAFSTETFQMDVEEV